MLLEVEQQLKTIPVTSSSRLLLGYSGGLDSCVLLHALCQLRQSLSFQLTAMHVHHGLSPNADNWATFCRDECSRLAVPFLLEKVIVSRNSGLGLEAAAREARYRALSSVQADWLCLAQHKDDQAETLLIQLARGAGVKGLSGMAGVDSSKKTLRPLLNLSRAQLLAYARQYKLDWVEDESNTDTTFDRNWWRLEALPKLKERYPAIVDTLARSARHFAEANTLLDELAAQDAEQCVVEKSLDLSFFAVLSKPRQRNLLRWWLSKHAVQLPSEVRLNQISSQLTTAGIGKSVHIKIAAAAEVRIYRGKAYLLEPGPALLHRAVNIPWHGESTTHLEDGSWLSFERMFGQGIALKHLNSSFSIGYRHGGEKIRLEANRPARGLKMLFQMQDIPPWQRDNVPLLYLNNTLAAIPNLDCAIHLRASQSELGLVATWFPVGRNRL